MKVIWFANGEKGQFLMQLFGKIVKIRNQTELKGK